MFKYNVPFETIVGLRSVNPIVRYVNENIPKKGKLVVYYELMHDNMPANLRKILKSLKRKNRKLQVIEFVWNSGETININASNEADMVIICGSFKLTDAFNRL